MSAREAPQFGTGEQRHDYIGAHHSLIGESSYHEPSGLVDVDELLNATAECRPRRLRTQDWAAGAGPPWLATIQSAARQSGSP